MQLVISLAALAAFLATLVYLHAVYKLHGILRTERPDWVDHRGALSFFYTGFPRVADPHVGAAVVRAAFSSRIRELQSPMASLYANRIRFCLPVGVAAYLVLIFAGSVSGP